MRIFKAKTQALRIGRHFRREAGLLCLAASLWMIPLAPAAWSQTLARPGWAGSGMTVERWWPHAVLCALNPDSLASTTDSGSTLHRLTTHIEDLQTLGIDAVLLRGLEPGASTSPSVGKSPGAVDLDPRYGTLEDFDQLVAEAVRHGVRVLVELHRGADGATTIADARFWLNRGVTGLALAGGDEAQVHTLRGVLHSYIGERILISGNAAAGADTGSSDSALLARAQTSRAAHRSAASPRADQPDLILVPLPPVAQGAAAMRQVLDHARALIAAHGPVPLLSASDAGRDTAAARVLATALLGSGGAVLLAADDLDLHNAAAPATSSIFAWYRQWTGLHRGNPVMRAGSDTLLDRDADGALVWVRTPATGGAAMVAICNLTSQPLHLSLVEDIAKLHLRGSFLRTIARTDNGMGAMPLRAVTLPPFGVYVGELSR